MEIKFEKWQGLGNDFIILENTDATSELAKKMCNRNFGIGADGIFSAIKPAKGDTDLAWRFYNSDGSVAQMCGNGMRCFAKYVYNKGLVSKEKFSVQTLAGVIIPEILETGKVRVDMGKPIFEANKIPATTDNPKDFEIEGFRAFAVSMGNPHCVIFTEGDSKKMAVEYGPQIERSSIFPEKTNVEFVEVIDREHIIANVFERGCGITMACGTGACACVVAGILKGFLDNTVSVKLPGGSLIIEYKEGGNAFMTGDAVKVFTGLYNEV